MSNEKITFTREERKPAIYKTVFVLVLIIVLFLSLFVYRVLQPRVLSVKEMVNAGAIMFDLPRQISQFALVDQDGKRVTNEVFNNHWTFVFFGFTYCPDICPATLAQFAQLEKKLADTPLSSNTQFMLVSVDPARDTPEQVKQYIQHFNPDFIGITADPKSALDAINQDFIQLKTLANQLNVAFRKIVLDHETGDYTVDHGGFVALINPQGFYHGFYKPPLDIQKMFLTYQSVRLSYD